MSEDIGKKSVWQKLKPFFLFAICVIFCRFLGFKLFVAYVFISLLIQWCSRIEKMVYTKEDKREETLQIADKKIIKKLPSSEKLYIEMHLSIGGILKELFPKSFIDVEEAYYFYKDFCEKAEASGTPEPYKNLEYILSYNSKYILTIDYVSGLTFWFKDGIVSGEPYLAFDLFSFGKLNNDDLKKEILKLFSENNYDVEPALTCECRLDLEGLKAYMERFTIKETMIDFFPLSVIRKRFLDVELGLQKKFYITRKEKEQYRIKKFRRIGNNGMSCEFYNGVALFVVSSRFYYPL